MDKVCHGLNIGTLATWLSVGAFGVLGAVVPGWGEVFVKQVEAVESVQLEPEITLGDAFASAGEGGGGAEAGAAEPVTAPLAAMEEAVVIPEMVEIPDLPPLPEVPDLPPPRPQALEKRAEATPSAPSAPAVRRVPRTGTQASAGRSVGAREAGERGRAGGASGAGAGAGKPGGGGAGMSDAARLAAGRMAAPAYPAFARRNNQTGTVIVEFTVDQAGRVISAWVKSSSKWPLLDKEAVTTVRRWKFPPGGVMKLQRPIVFKLT